MTRALVTAGAMAFVSGFCFGTLAAGCNDVRTVHTPDYPIVNYQPWQPGYSTERPVCVNADSSETKPDSVRCRWDCAYFWTPGFIGPRRIEKCWAKDADGYWKESGLDSDGDGMGEGCSITWECGE